MKKILILGIMTFILGCSSSNIKIDKSKYHSEHYDNRIRAIVVHYTALDDERSLRVLTQQKVSAHYVITTKDKDPVYSLVPDNYRAWHAGESAFGSRSNFNDFSIGIEMVNLGYDSSKEFKSRNTKNSPLNFRSPEYYYPYTDAQIKKVANLILHLQGKYNIPNSAIFAHSDISPQRKQDPGPLFPWKELYFKYNIGQWYNEEDKEKFMSNHSFKNIRPQTVKKYLRDYGYIINETDEWDDESRKVIYAFQMRYRPEKTHGNVDLETYAIIRALHTKYNPKKVVYEN